MCTRKYTYVLHTDRDRVRMLGMSKVNDSSFVRKQVSLINDPGRTKVCKVVLSS